MQRVVTWVDRFRKRGFWFTANVIRATAVKLWLSIRCFLGMQSQKRNPVAEITNRKTILNPFLNLGNSEGLFSVVCYNVLAGVHTNPRWLRYPYVHPAVLERKHRIARVHEELAQLRADIICLQEVESDLYEDTIANLSSFWTHHNVYKPRVEGVATMVRKSRFHKEIHFEPIDVDTLTKKACKECNEDPEEYTLLLGTIGIIAVYEDSNGKRIGIVNTHYTSWWQRPDIQSLQLSLILKRMTEISKDFRCPFIFCGDFNTTPDRAPYFFLSNANLEAEGSKLISGLPLEKSKVGPSNWKHNFPSLKSSYFVVQGKEPAFTNYTGEFIGTLDYIWFTSDRLEACSVLETVSELAIKPHIACPNFQFPSDHLSLKSTFRFKE